jgi:hypothetical protein
MRFTEWMIGERGAVVELVRRRLLTHDAAATWLGLTVRQVWRLVRRVEAADGALGALAYRRQHPAPNPRCKYTYLELWRDLIGGGLFRRGRLPSRI